MPRLDQQRPGRRAVAFDEVKRAPSRPAKAASYSCRRRRSSPCACSLPCPSRRAWVLRCRAASADDAMTILQEDDTCRAGFQRYPDAGRDGRVSGWPIGSVAGRPDLKVLLTSEEPCRRQPGPGHSFPSPTGPRTSTNRDCAHMGDARSLPRFLTFHRHRVMRRQSANSGDVPNFRSRGSGISDQRRRHRRHRRSRSRRGGHATLVAPVPCDGCSDAPHPTDGEA